MFPDSGSELNPVNLFIPKYFQQSAKPSLGISKSYLNSRLGFSDVIINILIFIPLGILLHGTLRGRWGLTLKISLGSLARWNLIHTWCRIDAAFCLDKEFLAHRCVYEYDWHCNRYSNKQNLQPVFKLSGHAPSSLMTGNCPPQVRCFVE